MLCLPTTSGYDVTLASAKGGAIPLDPGSKADPFLTEEGKRFMADGGCMHVCTLTCNHAGTHA